MTPPQTAGPAAWPPELRATRSNEQRTEQRAQSNPFSTRWIRPGAIPYEFPPGCSAIELTERLAQLGWRAAICGPHGSGKSTLLATLVPELQRRGRRPLTFTLHDGQRQLPAELIAAFPCDQATIVLVDGYEQLSHWSRWRLDWLCRRSGCGLLVTTHGATRLPELYGTTTDVELAQRIVEHLLGDGGQLITQDEAERAFAANDGNLRETLFALYDLFEQRRHASS